MADDYNFWFDGRRSPGGLEVDWSRKDAATYRMYVLGLVWLTLTTSHQMTYLRANQQP